MKPVEHWVSLIAGDPRPEAIHQALLHFEAECFDHAAGLVLDQAPTAVDPVGYRSIAAYLLSHALAVCLAHITDPNLLDPVVSIPSTSDEAVKMDTSALEEAIKKDEGYFDKQAPGQVSTPLKPPPVSLADMRIIASGELPPQTEYIPESPESST
jgi:hypothetical protein